MVLLGMTSIKRTVSVNNITEVLLLGEAAARARSLPVRSRAQSPAPIAESYVDSSMGGHKPAALHGVWAVGAEQSVQITVACGDTGAGTYAIGRTLVAALREVDPALAVHQKPLKTSLRRIRGLGGVDEVSEHVSVTLNLGGVHVTCGTCPSLMDCQVSSSTTLCMAQCVQTTATFRTLMRLDVVWMAR